LHAARRGRVQTGWISRFLALRQLGLKQ
jgi:hypothetical protein